MASVRDVKFQSSSDWFLFHLSHLEDFQFSTLETLWPQCEKCRAVYESLVYTSTEGEFGLMTKEILENLAKRQRVKPKLTESNLRRGNVPKYISFVEPMPVHQRPGTGQSSGYESGISVVSEDLLVSAGTEDEVAADSGDETGSEFLLGYDGVLLRGGLGERTVDVDEASQEAMFSSRSSFNKSEFDGSIQDTEGSDMEDKGAVNGQVSYEDHETLDSEDRARDENLINDEVQETDPLLDEMANVDENVKNLEDYDGAWLSKNLETNATDYNESVDGIGKDDDGVLGHEGDKDASMLPEFEPQKSGEEEDTFDSSAVEEDTSLETGDDDQLVNNVQVTFSEPLATDRRPSTNVSEDDTKNKELKSILKATNGDVNQIYEHEVDQSIMKRLTSPSETTEDTPTKPAMLRKSADLRPQSRPNVLMPDSLTHSRNKQEADEDLDTSDDEGLSDSDLHTSTGRRRKPKPKSNIYGKRANMKPPSQKLRKRKESNNSDNTDDDVIMSAESALLMEQILEQEKRLKEGMKPWLKGRLALSQQNSRFEIPMDVRLLETMTPMEYLTKYCIISKRRKALYQHVFQKVDKNRDGIINFTELEKGLKDVHTGILDSEHVENIVEMVHIDKEGVFDLKKFSAVAAFSERISCKYQLPLEMLNNFDGQKEVIECADFFALNWKLDGIKVNPDVKKILDSL